MSKDADTAALADFADAVITLARHLELRGAAAREVAELTGTEITVIREIHRTPGATATGVADSTGLQRSNTSTVIHRLEDAGLVRRGPSAPPGRGVGFTVTESAERNLQRMREYWASRLRETPPSLWRDFVQATKSLT